MTENTIIWNTYSLIEVETAEDKALFHRVMDGVYANDDAESNQWNDEL